MARIAICSATSETVQAGKCFAHNTRCTRERVFGDVHLAMQGLPCQPFSRMRSDRKKPMEHAQYNTVFGDFVEYLVRVRPKGWIVEEVVAFASRKHTNNQTFLEVFVDEAKQMGYYIEAVKMEASTWVETERDRPRA